ncbi:MAG: Uma2 family endonuclease, partial [Dehalococcoidia bacterium]
YAKEHPGPEDDILIIEVADTTLDYDRDTKQAFYAAAGIPEVSIWDLNGGRVFVHRQPVDGQYRRTSVTERGACSRPKPFQTWSCWLMTSSDKVRRPGRHSFIGIRRDSGMAGRCD